MYLFCYSVLLSNYLSGRMQFKVADSFGRFTVINSTDPGQRVSLMFFCHKFVAWVFIHLIFLLYFVILYNGNVFIYYFVNRTLIRHLAAVLQCFNK